MERLRKNGTGSGQKVWQISGDKYKYTGIYCVNRMSHIVRMAMQAYGGCRQNIEAFLEINHVFSGAPSTVFHSALSVAIKANRWVTANSELVSNFLL